tara:strand:- start:464 stop:697 length:234 start_codon:yes stop_codon:yes gene_type:complete
MSSAELVKEARDALKQKKKEYPSIPKYEYQQAEEEQFDEDLVYDISIRVKIKKNGKDIPARKDVLNWCGNILSVAKS